MVKHVSGHRFTPGNNFVKIISLPQVATNNMKFMINEHLSYRIYSARYKTNANYGNLVSYKVEKRVTKNLLFYDCV